MANCTYTFIDTLNGDKLVTLPNIHALKAYLFNGGAEALLGDKAVGLLKGSQAFKSIHTAIANGTATDVLDYLASQAKDKSIQSTAEQLKSKIPTDIKIKVLDSHPKGYGMSFNHKNNELNIYLDAWKGNANSAAYERGLTHEFIHAATSYQIDKNSDAKSALNSLISDLKTHAKNNKLDSALTELINHATANTHELLAYGLTEPSLQQLMQDIKASGDKTLWDKFVRTIADLLGIELDKEQESALSALLMVGDKLLGDEELKNSNIEKATKPQAYAALKFLNNFVSESQLSAMKSGMNGEEGQFFMDKAVEMQKRIESMPETYGQDGMGDKAIAYLHYFMNGMDWYITEKDTGSEDDAIKGVQEQAYGLADIGYGGETGYISIEEITNNGRNSAELDLYFTPKTIGEIQGKVEPTQKTDKPLKPVVLNGFDVTTFSEKLLSGESFKTIVQARKALSDKLIQSGTLDAKKADEAIELAGVIAARQIVAQGMSHEKTFDALSNLAEQLPSLNVRTSTSIAEQAYSTPLALAYVASVRAGIDGSTSVVEPTAGNGALLITVNPDNAIVNELNKDRAKALESQGFTVTTNNAVNYGFGNANSDVVIANPPFGTVKDDNGNTETFAITPRYKTNEIDHAIAFNALKAMKEDGNAVLIVGGVMTNLSDTAREDKYNGAAKRAFYGTLYNDYNVVDHFTVSGDLYAKQGAGYPVDVIVINGKGKSELSLPAASLPRVIQTTEELKNELQDNRASLRESRKATKQTDRAGATGDDVASGADAKQSRDSIANKNQRGDNGVQSGLAVNSDGIRGNDSINDKTGNNEVSRHNRANKLSDTSTSASQRIENAFQAEYTPSSSVNSIGTLVPVNMQTAINSALAKLSDKYTSVDNFVASQLNYEANDLGKYFSAEQVDAIALALDNIINGKGFIIGDQTGVGKGRVNAAMIRYAILNKITPIFVTEKPNLYSDMIRDLNDIGMSSVMPFATNTGGDGVIPLNKSALEWDIENSNAKENKLPTPKKPSDAIFAQVGDTQKAKEMAQMAYDGKLSGYDAVFTTYSQMQTIKGAQTDRMDFIEAMSKGALLILDESHNAGGTSVAPRKGASNGGSGATVEEGTKGGRAGFTRQLVQNSKGVFYSSATYAKRPDVLDLYSKTDMGLIADPQQLKESLQAGGVPLQQAVASMLAQAGQYIRREKSFDGIVYDTVFVDVDRQFAERASEIMRDIMQFDVLKASAIKAMDKQLKADARKMSSDRSTGSAGASSSNFTSVMHNMIGQMLLMLKVQPAIDEALSALKRGEKPVITLSNTMGSAIDEYAEEAGLNVGDAIGLHFGDLLARYLSKSRRVIEGDMYGKKESRYLDDEELGVVASKFYKDVMDKIDKYGFDKYPVSPIDAIHNALHKAGYKTGEITGRNSIIDYSESIPVYKKRPASQKNSAGKRKTISDFNNGIIDAVILNQSGATGLSLHSSPKVGTDTRKRYMIIAQPELNIDTHMQMLGRVNRTGQSNLPSYGQLTANIPAEKRPSAILAKKMAGLNAATTAGKDSAVKAKDVPDFMNDYGDEVAAAVMNDNRDIHALLGTPLKEKDTTGFETDGAMRRVTGRIPVLSLADQEKVYTMLEDAYDEYIDMLNKTGQNQLEAKAMALDAKTTATTQVVKPTSGSDSPFAEGVNAETVDVKKLGKPYTVEQITQFISDKTGITDGTSLREWREAQLNAIKQAYDARMAEINTMPTEDEQDIKQKRGNTDMLDAWSSKLITFVNKFSPYKSVLMFSPTGGQYLGFVGNLERKGDAKNYFALGNWKLTVYVADAAKSFTIPLSKISATGITEGKWSIESTSEDIKQAIESGNSESREERVILTGNMLAAYSFDKSGQIVNYTNDKGETVQGILMPKKFDLEKALDDKPVVFQSPRIAQSFIGSSTVDPAFSIRSSDNQLRIIPQHGGYSIRVPASKAQGGQYFLNPRLTSVMEDENFIKRGNEMVGTFNKESLGSVLDIVYQIAGKLQPISKDKGKEFLDSTGIKPSKSTKTQNTHTKATLTNALRTVMDREFGQGWFSRLLDTGKFKIVSRDEADKVISGDVLKSVIASYSSQIQKINNFFIQKENEIYDSIIFELKKPNLLEINDDFFSKKEDDIKNDNNLSEQDKSNKLYGLNQRKKKIISDFKEIKSFLQSGWFSSSQKLEPNRIGGILKYLSNNRDGLTENIVDFLDFYNESISNIAAYKEIKDLDIFDIREKIKDIEHREKGYLLADKNYRDYLQAIFEEVLAPVQQQEIERETREQEKARKKKLNQRFAKANTIAKFWNAAMQEQGMFMFGQAPENITDIGKIIDAVNTSEYNIDYSDKGNKIVLTVNGVSGSFTIHDANTKEPYIRSDDAPKIGGKDLGSLLYQIAYSWAHNNNKTIVGDPGGLSRINHLRRAFQMLSSGMRYGSLRHVYPSDSQVSDGLNWSGKSTDNISNLIDYISNKVFDSAPNLNDITYNLQDGKFYKEKKEVDNFELSRIARESNDARSHGVGLATAKMAIVTRALREEISRNTQQDGRGMEDSMAKLLGLELAKNPSNKAILKSDKDGNIQAFYNPSDDTTYFVAENIDKGKDLLGLVNHEIGVHALQLGKNDPEFYNIMEQMLKVANISKPAKQALATALESFGITRVPEQGKPELVKDDDDNVIESVTREQVLHELGGYIVEHHPKLGIVQKFLAWFKSKLRDLGKSLSTIDRLKWVKWAFKLNEKDLVFMATSALKGAPDSLVFDSVGRSGEAVKLSEQQARFYSALRKAFLLAPEKVFTSGAAVKAWINGNAQKFEVKKDEIYWSGLNDWLDIQGKVSRDDVVRFLDENGVKVEDVELSDNQSNKAIDNWLSDADASVEYSEDEDGYTAYYGGGYITKGNGEPRIYDSEEDAWDVLKEEAKDQIDDYQDEQLTKHGDESKNLVLPSGTDYRELVITIPSVESWNENDETHFGDVGHGKQIAWIRHNTRTDNKLGSGLFLEEVQSQRGSSGRTDGFSSEKPKITKFNVFLKGSYQDSFLTEKEANEYVDDFFTDKEKANVTITPIYSELEGVPPAPFITDNNNKATNAYISLLMKKAISQAIDNGQNFVAWTTGDQQADRYSLDKSLKKIDVSIDDGNKNVTLHPINGEAIELVVDDNGVIIDGDDFVDKNLADVVGKDMADKILSMTESQTLKGDGLKIKAGWTQAMYGDEQGLNQQGKPSLITQAAGEIARKFGGKIGTVNLSTGTQPALIITPEMRQKVLNEGMPLFSKAKTVDSESGKLLAPNGKPSNLNAMQYAQVRTPEFKAWFGSWQEQSALDNLLSGINRGKMLSSMVSSISNSQILDSVIASIPIDVMNNLGGSELATDMFLNNPSMLINVLSSSLRNPDVFAAFSSNSESVIALTRAKLSSTKPTSSNAEIITALHTLQNNLVAILQSSELSNIRVSGMNSFSSARAATKPLSLGFFDKFSTTELANHINSLIDKYKVDYTTDQTAIEKYNSSKVVDENGEPKVVYRGSHYEIPSELNAKTTYFTESLSEAKAYADTNIKSSTGEKYSEKIPDSGYLSGFFLDIKNIAELNRHETYFSIPEYMKKDIAEWEFNGFDGVKMPWEGANFGENSDIKNYIAFSPSQIKSATNNTGAFSKDNNDIRYSKSSLQSKITNAIDENWLDIVNEMKRQGVIEIRC